MGRGATTRVREKCSGFAASCEAAAQRVSAARFILFRQSEGKLTTKGGKFRTPVVSLGYQSYANGMGIPIGSIEPKV